MTRHLIGITSMAAQRSVDVIDKLFAITSDFLIKRKVKFNWQSFKKTMNIDCMREYSK